MNLDALILSFLTKELNDKLLNGRIDKIYQINNSAICLHIYNNTDKYYLTIDIAQSVMRLMPVAPLHLDVPPAFCMLLRKHLEGTRITAIKQYQADRIIILQTDTLGYDNQIVTKELYIELTGKNSNIILVSNNKILQPLKCVNSKQSSFRQILPNIPYVLPPQKQATAFWSIPVQELIDKLQDCPPGSTLSRAILANTCGIGLIIAQELIWRCGFAPGITIAELDSKDYQALSQAVLQVHEELRSPQEFFAYNRNGRFLALAPLKLYSLADSNIQVFKSVPAAIEYFAALKPIESPEQEDWAKKIAQEIIKQEKKLHLITQELSQAENYETYKIYADNLMTYLYTIDKKLTEVTITDIYTGDELTIPLDSAISTLDNANLYYKRYNKAKRAINLISEQIRQTQEMLSYLGSLQLNLQHIQSKTEMQEFKEELVELGLLKAAKKTTKATTKSANSKPIEITLNENTKVYVGKNNKQNDYLTFKMARSTDIWLHTKDIPGSHVIIKTTKPQPSESEILAAAKIAAYFSKAQSSSNVPVDYTERKNVRKPSGSKPGFVIYERQTTLYVTPKDIKSVQTSTK